MDSHSRPIPTHATTLQVSVLPTFPDLGAWFLVEILYCKPCPPQPYTEPKPESQRGLEGFDSERPMEPDWRLGECVPQHLLQQHSGEVCVEGGWEVDALGFTFPDTSAWKPLEAFFTGNVVWSWHCWACMLVLGRIIRTYGAD